MLNGKSPFSAQGKIPEMWPTPKGATNAYKMGLTSKPTHNVPTPTASDHIERKSTSTEVLNKDTNKSVSLDRWVKFWPTPTKSDYKGPNMSGGKSASCHGLATTVARTMWPTPQASDNRDRGNLSNPSVQRRLAIGKQVSLGQSVSLKSGSLNPTWVEWLQGFPLGWTDLD
jgi:hypothetical protein